MALDHIHVELDEANEFIEQLHRHHKRAQGHRFSLGAVHGDRMVGVAVVGRPVSREKDHRRIVEVTRLCTDGTKNACSFLYAAAARAARTLGYKKIGTYILKSESGVSLKAAGWKLIGEVKGRSWSCPSRPRTDKHPTVDKLYWELSL